jgi:ATP-dependent protease HslVU (ClpYQ) peptidase subunit
MFFFGGLMTCVIGYVQDGHVWIAGDSLSIDSTSMEVGTRTDPKVFMRTASGVAWVFGFSGSYRFGQILLHEVTLPTFRGPDRDDVHRFLVKRFIPRLRKAASEGGASSNENGIETGGALLIGINGQLFAVDTDFQVASPTNSYYAIGAGAHFASASLYTMLHLKHKTRRDPERMVTIALECAEHHSGAVRRPWVIVHTP